MSVTAYDDFGLIGITWADDADLPLSDRVFSGIRSAILSERIRVGQRLPSTRALATELGVSRGTIVKAYEQLQIEGYVRTKAGAGTYVQEVPERFIHAEKSTTEAQSDVLRPQISSRASIDPMPYVENSAIRVPKPLQTGLAPLDGFPRHLFARLAGEAIRSLTFEDLSYGDPRGYQPLREAIASYLQTARAVECRPTQVFVTNGAQQAISLAAHVLADHGDPVWMENPGYAGAHAAFAKAGLQLVPVTVDREGLSVEDGKRRESSARLAYVSPSHQYPLGVTMSLQRRRDLLDWASRRGAWLIEDDYDSEYRYQGLPLPSLFHLAGGDHVVYVGSFSKALAPGLRLGYAVVPERLIDPFMRIRSSDDHHGTILVQVLMAQFIAGGHYGRHLRRMRTLGRERRDALIRSFRRRLPHLSISGTEGGLHAFLSLHPSVDDMKLSARAAEKGLSLTPVSISDLENEPRTGFTLGYAAYTEDEIDRAVAKLAAVLSDVPREGERRETHD